MLRLAHACEQLGFILLEVEDIHNWFYVETDSWVGPMFGAVMSCVKAVDQGNEALWDPIVSLAQLDFMKVPSDTQTAPHQAILASYLRMRHTLQEIAGYDEESFLILENVYECKIHNLENLVSKKVSRSEYFFDLLIQADTVTHSQAMKALLRAGKDLRDYESHTILYGDSQRLADIAIEALNKVMDPADIDLQGLTTGQIGRIVNLVQAKQGREQVLQSNKASMWKTFSRK